MTKINPAVIAQRYLKASQDKDGPNSDLLLDLAAFLIGWEALHRLIEGGTELAPEAESHYEQAGMMLRRFQPALATQMELVLGPVMEAPALRRYKALFNRATRPSPGKRQALIQAEVLKEVFPALRSRGQMMRDTFKGRALKGAMQLGGAASEEDPKATLNKVANIVPVTGKQILRKWNVKAAKLADVGLTDIENLVADSGAARILGEKLRDIEAKLASLDPTSQEAADLAAEQQSLQTQVEALADGSSDRQVVLSAAMSTAASGDSVLLTKTAKEVNLTPQQEDAMRVKGKSIIAAGAGSGKTRVLAAKVVYTIKELGASPNQIIATSFSRKSAHELFERVKKYGGEGILDDKAAEDGFGTTHSVAGGIISKYGPDGSAYQKIIQGGDQSTLIKMAMAQVQMRPDYGQTPEDPDSQETWFPDVGSVETPVDPSPGEGAETSIQDTFDTALKAALDAYQWQEDKYGPARWRTYTINLINDMIGRDPTTLTDKQKDAVNKALGHPVGGRKGRPFTLRSLERAGVGGFKLASAQPVDKTAARSNWNTPANQWFNLGQELKDADGRAMGSRRFGTAISKYKANLLTPGQAWNQDRSMFAAVFGAYEWLKKNDPKYVGRRDHDDTLIQASATLIANPAALGAVKSRFKYIFVDEAQDLNKAQHLLFGLIAGYYDPETQEPNIDGSMNADTYTFIGDDKQAIYEFRGADPDVFIGMSDLVPEGAGFETMVLDTNFRSGKSIVDAANKLMEHNTKQIPMTCNANVERKGMGEIQARPVESHQAGAEYAADQIELLTEGEAAEFNYDDFGIACRTNAEAYAFGVEMLKRGIPFRSKMNFFNDYTTKAIIAWLSLANANAGDRKAINEAVLECYKAPRFWLDQRFEKALQKQARGQNYLEYLENGGWRTIYDQDWRNRRNVKPYTEALRRIFDLGTSGASPEEMVNEILALSGSEFKGKKTTFVETLIENLKKDGDAMDILAEESPDGSISEDAIREAALSPIQPLLGILGNYGDLGPAMDYVGQLQNANRQKGKKDDPNASDYDQPAVVVDTVHGWKGLECKRLFVNMPAGVFPHVKSTTEEDLASERRLAYVALTRGEDRVDVLAPSVNHLGKPAGKSRFIDEACIPTPLEEVEEEQEEQDTGKTASGWSESALDAFLAEDWDYFEPQERLASEWWGE